MKENITESQGRASAASFDTDTTDTTNTPPGHLRALGKQVPTLILAMVLLLPAIGAALASVGGVGETIRLAALVLQSLEIPTEAIVGAQSYVANSGTSLWIAGALIISRLAALILR